MSARHWPAFSTPLWYVVHATTAPAHADTIINRATRKLTFPPHVISVLIILSTSVELIVAVRVCRVFVTLAAADGGFAARSLLSSSVNCKLSNHHVRP